MCTVADTKIEIDDEFEALLPARTDAEKKALKDAIEQDGVFRDDLIYWREGKHNWLLDGHGRLEVWQGLPTNQTIIPPPHVKEIKLPDRHAAVLWILRHQLGRRNLSENAAAIFRGRLYNETKNDAGRPKQQDEINGDTKVPISGSTAQVIADETKVSAKTVKRDGAYVTALDAIGKVNPKAKADIETGVMKLAKADVVKLAKSDDIGKGLANVRNGKKWNDGVVPKPKVARADADMPPRQVDEDGNEVPANLIGVFEARATFRTLSRRLRDIAGELAELKKATAGRHLDEAPQLAEELAAYVDAAMPAYLDGRGWKPAGSEDA